jgi:calcineurin-like phosphoesterase family protein
MTRNISLFQNKFPGENLFFTSDTHFFHEGIIRFCNRPFGSVEEMNETLIRNWNEKVPEDGTVFHLGDFAMGGSAEWSRQEYVATLWACSYKWCTNGYGLFQT